MKILGLAFALAAAALLTGCATCDTDHVVLISVPEQKMTVLNKGAVSAEYPVSTSKFGLGDHGNSYATPLGKLVVADKFGDGVKSGTVFKSRRPTGEIVAPNSPGRDPIVSRILWLKGLESQNHNAYARFIYIHGTTEEWRIGSPASYGCIRMKSRDVIRLYSVVGVGTRVEILNEPTEAILAATPEFKKPEEIAAKSALSKPVVSVVAVKASSRTVLAAAQLH